MACIENGDADKMHLRSSHQNTMGQVGGEGREERREKFKDDYNLSQQLKDLAVWTLRKGKQY